MDRPVDKAADCSLENGADVVEEGLIDRADRLGIKAPIIDTGGPCSGGSGLRTLTVAKAKWGLPCGCDLTHMIQEGEGLRTLEAAMATVTQAAGADMVFAGQPAGWETLVRTIALIDPLMSQAAVDM